MARPVSKRAAAAGLPASFTREYPFARRNVALFSAKTAQVPIGV
jgi:hypothetical protein